MIFWRIVAETRSHRADDLGGAGAATLPGRWNDEGEAVVYCAPTIAMAVLETAAHVDDASVPLDRYLVEIRVPDGIWARREELETARLPAAWDAIPAGRASLRSGSEWLSSLHLSILLVPSAIVPEERVTLINPRHPDAARITARAVRRFEYNRLCRRRRRPIPTCRAVGLLG